jgi:Zn-dependent M28 family amino/carboxypeptidase
MEKVRENMVSTVGVLSEDIGVRSYRDIDSLNRAADFIEEKLRSFGFDPRRQPFDYEGVQYYNIDVEAKGAAPEVLVVGAHYDTVVGSPGADDNASGVAGLMELARLTAASPLPLTVRFVAFSLEEPPAFRSSRMGSAVYARALREEGAPVRGMISLEMLGYYCDQKGCQYYPTPIFKLRYPKKGDFIAFVGNTPSKAMTLGLKEAFRQHSSVPVESLNTTSLVPGVDFSDHRSFWKEGFHAFMVTDTAFYRNPNYHGPGDTADTLDYDRAAEVVKGLFGAVRDAYR